MLTYQILDGKYFDRWSPWTCKGCNALKIDGLNFDSLGGKHEKRQNFALCGTTQLYISITSKVI